MSSSKLSIGIVGLPNVGKSTLFKALTKNEVVVANYPFATIDPNIGVVSVPDERLERLNALSNSKNKIPAVVEFYDVAGLVKGANKGEGLGNQFLSHIRETNVIIEVLRCFPSEEIIHVEQSVDPIRDLEIINTELALKDLETIEKVWKKLEGEARAGSKEAQIDLESLKQAKTALEKGELLFNKKQHPYVFENVRMQELTLLTAKSQLYLLNGRSNDVSEELKKKIIDLGALYVIVDLSKFYDLSELIIKAYEVLGLISFFTTGKDETRAWTIEKGIKAPKAAGVIHSDFEKKFIRAELIEYKKLIEAGGWQQAKQKGWLRLEGKEYVIADGDVMEVRHG